MNVWVIDCWDGPRHRRVKRIWREAAKILGVGLKVFKNRGAKLNHWISLKEIWKIEINQNPSSRWVVFTEYDFLPDLCCPFQLLLPEENPVLACEFVNRDTPDHSMVRKGYPAPYWLLIDKKRIRHLDFSPNGIGKDPCNGLDDYLEKFYGARCKLLEPEDCLPRHYGVRYAVGTHLFWMRHWNDSPDTVIGEYKFHLGTIQKGVDYALEEYERLLFDPMPQKASLPQANS